MNGLLTMMLLLSERVYQGSVLRTGCKNKIRTSHTAFWNREANLVEHGAFSNIQVMIPPKLTYQHWSACSLPTGLRSDSDMFTFGFPWKPWTEKEPIAQGSAIVQYLQRTVTDDGIDKKIRFNHGVNGLSWSSKERTGTIHVSADETSDRNLRSRFVILPTGYYDYEQPLPAHIPGLSNFGGSIVHPQFWPKDLEHRGKNVAIIGSGATAITLLPALAKEANHVTMAQRSPSYILSIPVEDRLETKIRAMLPKAFAATFIRLKWIVLLTLFRKYCVWFPNAGRRFMSKAILAELNEDEALDPNFSLTYNPFEQRMCMYPNGDFYQCLRKGKGSIRTGTIETATEDSIMLKSGEVLHQDAVVTATGLKLKLGGGIDISVDGNRFHVNEHYVWKGLMFDGVPNLAFSFGYFDASWTLGVDISAQLTCRLLK